MGLLRAVVGVVACCLLLVGCSDDDPVDPSPSPTTDSPTSASTTAAPPVEPVLPDAAKKADEGGARAFIAYYWDLINYAQVTGDVKGLERVSGPSCDGCDAGIDGIRKIYRDGGRVTGSPERITIGDLNRLDSSSAQAIAFHGTVVASHDSQTVTASDGAEDIRGQGSDRFDVYVLWTKSTWRLDVMEIQ